MYAYMLCNVYIYIYINVCHIYICNILVYVYIYICDVYVCTQMHLWTSICPGVLVDLADGIAR